MSTETAVLTPEQLDAKTTVENKSKDVAPMTRDYLYGTPGTTYALQATNLDDELEANVWAANGRDKSNYLMDDLNLEPGETKTKMFQMGPKGYVTVWNWTPNTFYPIPTVNFRLKAK